MWEGEGKKKVSVYSDHDISEVLVGEDVKEWFYGVFCIFLVLFLFKFMLEHLQKFKIFYQYKTEYWVLHVGYQQV